MSDGSTSGLIAQVERVLVQIECLEGQHMGAGGEVDRGLVAALGQCRDVLRRAIPDDPDPAG